jgi:glycosyltransferase 2 family protein
MTDAPARETSFFRRHIGRLIGSVVVTISVLWGAKHFGLELIPKAASFANVRWWTVPVYLVFVIVMTYFRATRWRFLLRKVGAEVPREKILRVSMVGFAAILLLPFRLGEFVRPAMLREKGKVSFSAATGSIIGERIVDGFYLSLVLAIALLVVPKVSPLPDQIVGLPPQVTTAKVIGYAYFTLAGFTAALVTIAVYFFAHDFAKRATLAVFGIVSKKLAERLAHEAERLADGLHFLKSPKDAAGFMFESTMYWGINAAGMWLLAWGCGLEHADGSAVNYGEACAMMGMLGVTILIPGPPGLLGIFQAGMFCGMTLYFPTESVVGHGAVYAFLLFAVQVSFTIIGGAVALFMGRGGLSEIAAAETSTEEESKSTA